MPLALENIAALIAWPGEELTEGQFLAELVERTGVRLLIDVANLHTNHVNRGEDPAKALDELPVEAIAYVHVAGGIDKDGVWHDTRPPGDPAGPGRTRRTPLPDRPARRSARARRRLPAGGGTGRRTDRCPHHVGGGREGPVGLHVRGGGVRSRHRRYPGHLPGPARRRRQHCRHRHRCRHRGARDRAAVAQTALLSALVAGTPAPEGFDHRRLGIQSRALAAKRADVVAKVAPELPGILGDGYRDAFLSYARTRPMSAGYRRDALDFAEQLLISGRPADDAARRRLTHWWQDRAAARPPRRTTRLVRAARAAIAGR